MPVKSWLDESSSDDDNLPFIPKPQAQLQGDDGGGSRAPPVGPLSAGPASQAFTLSDSDYEDDSGVGRSLASRSRGLLDDSESEDGRRGGADTNDDAADSADEEKGTQNRAGHGKEPAKPKVVHVLSDDEDEERYEGGDEHEGASERQEMGHGSRGGGAGVGRGGGGATQTGRKAPSRGVSSRTRRRRKEADEMSEVASSDEEEDYGYDEDDDELWPTFHNTLYEDDEPAPLVLEEAVIDEETGQVIKPAVQVPLSVNRYLAPYQKEGVRFMYERFKSREGGILGDEPGLGKTIQSTAFLLALLGKTGTLRDRAIWKWRKRRRERKREVLENESVLVVGPSAVDQQWNGELTLWGNFDVLLFRSSKKKKAEIFNSMRHGTAEILYISYDSLRRYISELSAIRWRVVIFDEFHGAKNPKSRLTQACAALKALVKIGLTGTPIQNNLEELWSLFHVLAPERAKTREEWKDEFSMPIRRMLKRESSEAVKAIGREKQAIMHTLLRKLVLKRGKNVIRNRLKNKVENIIFCPLTKLQYETYHRCLELPEFRILRDKDDDCPCGRMVKNKPAKRGKCCFGVPYAEGSMDTEIHPNAELWRRKHPDGFACDKCPNCLILQALHVLGKISNHPSLLQVDAKYHTDEEKRTHVRALARLTLGKKGLKALGGYERSQRFEDLRRTHVCGKLQSLEHLLRRFDQAGDRTLLFSWSVQMLNILQAFCVSKGYEWTRLDGNTKGPERDAIIRRFSKTDSTIKIFLISTKAGGLGLNLTAANRVVIFDVNWNPSFDLQAQDRAFRLGQLRDVEVYRLVSQGTLEELIYMRQIYKQQLNSVAMCGVVEDDLDEDSAEYRRIRGMHYDAIQGVHGEEGELFGIKNLLQLSAGSILKSLRQTLRQAGSGGAMQDEEGPVTVTEQDIAEVVRQAGELVKQAAEEEVVKGTGASRGMEVDEEELEDDMEVSATKLFGLFGVTAEAAVRLTHETEAESGSEQEDDWLEDAAVNKRESKKRASASAAMGGGGGGSSRGRGKKRKEEAAKEEAADLLQGFDDDDSFLNESADSGRGQKRPRTSGAAAVENGRRDVGRGVHVKAEPPASTDSPPLAPLYRPKYTVVKREAPSGRENGRSRAEEKEESKADPSAPGEELRGGLEAEEEGHGERAVARAQEGHAGAGADGEDGEDVGVETQVFRP